MALSLIKFSTSAEKKNPLKNDFPLTITFFPLKIDKHVLKRYFSTEILGSSYAG